MGIFFLTYGLGQVHNFIDLRVKANGWSKEFKDSYNTKLFYDFGETYIGICFSDMDP